MELAKLASVIPFAHLIGVRGKIAEEDEKVKKSKRAEDDPDAEEEDKNPDAEENEDDPDAEEEDKDPEASEDEPDAEDEDTDAEDDKEDKSAKKARLSERKRCRAIFNCKAAGARPDLAAYLAFDTNHSASSAIGLINQAVAGQPKKSGLYANMSEQNLPKVRSDVAGNKPRSMAQSMIASYDQLKKK